MFLEEDLYLYSNNDPPSMSVSEQSTSLPAEGSVIGSCANNMWINVFSLNGSFHLQFLFWQSQGQPTPKLRYTK